MRICLLLSILVPLQAQTWKRVASIAGPNCGGRTFVLEIAEEDSEYSGDFTRLIVKTPNLQDLVLTSWDGWYKFRSRRFSFIPKEVTSRFPNRVKSDFLYCASIPNGKRRRTFLFLIGSTNSPAPPTLTILALDSSRPPEVVFEEDNLGFANLLDVNGDGAVDLVGFTCYMEPFFDDWDKINPAYQSYAPYDIHELPQASGGVATYSEQLSRDYNLKRYYGWAGRCGNSGVAIKMPSKSGERPQLVPVPK